MVGFGCWIDAHGHLADLRWEGQQGSVIQEARAQGIHFFMQGGVGPEDWQRQKDLQAQFPHHIGLCFGLHPYWVVDHDEEQCEQALDLLASQLVDALGLGEMGLDFRPHIMKDSRERQIGVFEAHIELAHISAKPMVLHLVQAHEESLRIMDVWGLPKQKGMVHSFNGSWGKAEDFLKRGFYLSIGGPVCRAENRKLHQAVKELPLEYLLIESDSPDQPPPVYKDLLNPPQSIWEVARSIGELKSLDPLEILDITTENFKRLFAMDIQKN
ncbi:MAG: TatD family hydrolase [Pseudobdellovibrionaceae bacterium]